jgi:ribosomal protein S18 acetylase RimI-like enzyme
MAVELVAVSTEREAFLPLLLEADESEAIVRTYLDEGVLFAVSEDGDVGGVVLVTDHPGDPGARELRNIAVRADRRGRGIGGRAVALLVERLRADGATKLVVGTADTSADAQRFYRRCGFREIGRRPGYFDRYPRPVIEGGVVAHDMVMFGMDLGAA